MSKKKFKSQYKNKQISNSAYKSEGNMVPTKRQNNRFKIR